MMIAKSERQAQDGEAVAGEPGCNHVRHVGLCSIACADALVAWRWRWPDRKFHVAATETLRSAEVGERASLPSFTKRRSPFMTVGGRVTLQPP